MRTAASAVFSSLLLALFANPAPAQTPPAPAVRMGTMSFGNPGMAFAGPVIVDAPYSAKEVFEHNQTLADGTHISQKPRTTLLFRDSQGRTRTERSISLGPNQSEGPRRIEIMDPIAGFQYTLDEQNHVAHRVALTAPTRMAPGGGGGTSRAIVGQISAVPPPPPPPPPPPAVSPAVVVNGQAPQGQRMQHQTESLGTQVMEGVTVEGHRNTTTIPEGMQGNDRPLVTVSESWISPDLKRPVLTKTTDPRNGETIIRLTDIVVGEPDPALFQPPPDYTVVDEKGPFQIQYTYPPAR